MGPFVQCEENEVLWIWSHEWSHKLLYSQILKVVKYLPKAKDQNSTLFCPSVSNKEMACHIILTMSMLHYCLLVLLLFIIRHYSLKTLWFVTICLKCWLLKSTYLLSFDIVFVRLDLKPNKSVFVISGFSIARPVIVRSGPQTCFSRQEKLKSNFFICSTISVDVLVWRLTLVLEIKLAERNGIVRLDVNRRKTLLLDALYI